jgi:hypothetical protein
MEISPRKWGWDMLVATCTAYWAGLAAVTHGPFARRVWDLVRLPGSHGSASLSLDNGCCTSAHSGMVRAFGAAPHP